MQQAYQQTQQVFSAYLDRAKGSWAELSPDITLTATETFIQKLQNAHSATGNAIPVDVPNFSYTSLITPDQQRMSAIILSESVTRMVIVMAAVVGSFLIVKVFVFTLRRTVRFGLRTTKAFTSLIEEERAREESFALERTWERSQYNQLSKRK